MAVLSPEQTAQLAYDAGFRGQALTTITAIAGPESGYDSGQLNDNPGTGDYSVGLWQINYYQGLYGPRSEAYGTPDQLISDPVRQARAAFDISGQGQNFNPWTTYSSGAYLQYWDRAQQAVNNIMGGATMPGAVGSPGTITLDSSNSQLASKKSPTSGSDPTLINIPMPPPISDIHILHKSTARKGLGGLIVVGGGIFILVGAALLAGEEATKFVPNVGGLPGAISDMRLNRKIDQGSKVSPPSRSAFNRTRRGKSVDPNKPDPAFENAETLPASVRS